MEFWAVKEDVERWVMAQQTENITVVTINPLMQQQVSFKGKKPPKELLNCAHLSEVKTNIDIFSQKIPVQNPRYFVPNEI